jgi:asparagine synthase (glutamine-hydrolysing)
MCGISGVVRKDNQRVERRVLEGMNNLVAHRGPDDEGSFYTNNIALGHRRLAILDLTEAGHQPMSFKERLTIVYNGEVYNYRELKSELEQEGYVFRSTTDTEVILAAYDHWGEACVERFNGMWSFCIYDSTKEVLFCSRDRFGIKPFYYMNGEDKFAFGSEIKQLLGFLPDRFLNVERAMDYLVAGFHDHTEQTFFEGVLQLRPAHNLTYNLRTHQVKIRKYYEIAVDPELSTKNFDAAKELYEKELVRAVEYRLRSDVKVGTCLSGGLDSSAVSTLASSRYHTLSNRRFQAIHAKSSEAASDESHYANLVGEAAQIDLQIIEPSSGEFRTLLREVVRLQEEPFGSPSVFMQYFVMRQAKASGCKVMLDGQGGDETLLGYEKYYPAVYLHLLRTRGLWFALGQLLKSRRNNTKM